MKSFLLKLLCGPGNISLCSNSLRAGRLGIESRRGRDFPHSSRPGLERSPLPPVECLPGVKRPASGGVHLAPRVFVACSRVNLCFFYLYI